MKIVLTTSSDRNTLAAYYQKHLEQMKDVQVIPAYTFDVEEQMFASLYRKILSRLIPSIVTRRSTAFLLEKVRETRPDFVLVFKGMYLHSSAIKELRGSGIRLINYNPDHPIHFDSLASGSPNIRKSLPHYNLVYTYSDAIKRVILQRIPSANVKVLPFGFEPSPHNSNDLWEVNRVNRVCFVGTSDPDRRDLIRKILKAGFPVDVFGNGYAAMQKEFAQKLAVHSPAFGSTYNSLLQSYDVQMNIFRRQNHNAHNMRTFEIPAVGGIQVCEFSEQCAGFFSPGKEIFMYKDDDALMTQLEHLLGQSDASKMEYKLAARQRCLSADYSYRRRAQQMVEDLKQL